MQQCEKSRIEMELDRRESDIVLHSQTPTPAGDSLVVGLNKGATNIPS